jgi:heme-degrading monooxygenase HmoA
MTFIKKTFFTLLAAMILSTASNADEALILSDVKGSDGTSFAEQLRSAQAGQITLLNTFLVPEGETEAFRQGWRKVAEVLRRQPGFISTSLHRPVGDSNLWVNHAVWESTSAFVAALVSPEFRAVAASMKQSGFRRLYRIDTALGPTH